MATDAGRADRTPASMADLHLPPTFLSEHGLRALFYRGALSPVDLAAHWRVPQEVGVEIVESMKGAGLVEPDAGQGTFERHARVRLSAAGRAQLADARQRTWYSGALPVSLRDFAAVAATGVPAITTEDAVRGQLAPFFLESEAIDSLGQLLCGADCFALTGAAPDEQPALAYALGQALIGEVELPYAIFAAGAVIRIFDPAHHQVPRDAASAAGELDILRSHEAATSQWMRVRPPIVALSGGVLPSDVAPPFDDDARFYLAPPPLIAFGGLLAVFEADAAPAELADLARHWLLPGKHGAGIVLLRSGERIELPWRASTVLFAADQRGIAAAAAATAAVVDISELSPAALTGYLTRRLRGDAGAIAEPLAIGLEAEGLAARGPAARAARYVADAAAYTKGRLGDDAVRRAVAYAAAAPPSGPSRLSLAS